uniref:Uncharacterized protein n=1 Tax=Rhizophora mucronata TaxID=61149 RepID=A0A2P2P3M1_RHIMU
MAREATMQDSRIKNMAHLAMIHFVLIMENLAQKTARRSSKQN